MKLIKQAIITTKKGMVDLSIGARIETNDEGLLELIRELSNKMLQIENKVEEIIKLK